MRSAIQFYPYLKLGCLILSTGISFMYLFFLILNGKGFVTDIGSVLFKWGKDRSYLYTYNIIQGKKSQVVQKVFSLPLWLFSVAWLWLSTQERQWVLAHGILALCPGRSWELPHLGLIWGPPGWGRIFCLTELNELKAFQMLSTCERKNNFLQICFAKVPLLFWTRSLFKGIGFFISMP